MFSLLPYLWWNKVVCAKTMPEAYLSRSLSDFDEIWHGDAVRPSWPLKIWNFKIQDGGGRHPEKSKQSPYLSNGLTDRHNIWHDDAYWPSEPDKQLKFRTFKNPWWQTADVLKNLKMLYLWTLLIAYSKLVIKQQT